MSSPQYSSPDGAIAIQLLDVERVSAHKPEKQTGTLAGIFKLHSLTTLVRLCMKALAMPFREKLFCIELSGREFHVSEKLVVVYIGDKSNYEYILSTLFSGEPGFCRERKCAWWSVNRVFKRARKQADLVVGDIDFPLDLFVRKTGALVLPRWLKQKVRIADEWEHVLANLRRKTRREALRSIRKHHLTARVIRDARSDRSFYHQLYQPYIHRRYGSQATVVDEGPFLRECATGRLVQVIQDDRVLGAVLVHIAGKQLTLAWVGIDQCVEGDKLNGVTDALDLYSLMYAYTQGCDAMDMGGSRPFINDGVLRYKTKWGAAVSLGLIPKGSFYFAPQRMSAAMESFLLHNPMIIRDGRRLYCVNWISRLRSSGAEAGSVEGVSAEEEAEIVRLMTKMHRPGFAGFHSYRLLDGGQYSEIRGYVDGDKTLPYRITTIPRKRLSGLILGVTP
jgi:hypothetical protein